MRSYTSLEQSKKLAEILPIESADMAWYPSYDKEGYSIRMLNDTYPLDIIGEEHDEIPAWSLAALLEELNRNCWKVSLKCCGAEWDMTYDDGEKYISVSSDYAIDACYEMILKLHEQKLL